MKFDPPPSNRSNQLSEGFSTSGWLTPLLVALLCVVLLVAAFEHGRGNLHRLKTAVDPQSGFQPPKTTGPGGQDPIRLTRSATAIGSQPEFISATLLPGRGMNLFELMAAIPGHGEVPLIVSPSLADATQLLSGAGDDVNGSRSTSLGGAFLVPWAGHLTGSPVVSSGSTAPDMPKLQTLWQDQRLAFPAAGPNSTLSVEGMLLNRITDTVKTTVIGDGQSAQATFHGVAPAPPASSDWPSTYDVSITVELTGRTLDLSVTTTNTGRTPMPVGTGWHPYFAIPSGDRANALLTIPSTNVVEVNRHTGLPTGKTVAIDNAPINFMHAAGSKLGTAAIDETYVDLQSGILADGPIAQLRDPAFNYLLRIIPLTDNIKNMRVIAPADKQWVSIGPATNLDDPFGPEWKTPEDSGIVTLAPGDSFHWKVRLEISLSGASGGTM